MAAAVVPLAGVPALSAQTASPTTPGTAACLPTANLEQLITALDSAITGPATKDRSCFRALMLPQVRLIPVSAPTATPRILTADDWIAAVAKRGASIVTEKQIKVQTETFGNVAHLWTTYETYIDGTLATRGINSIQAVFDGQNWKIVEVVWQAENPTLKVPAQYMP
jgi:hypothetical protein